MNILHKAVSASVLLLAATQGIRAQGSGLDGVHVNTFVEEFDYETLTGTVRVESFVEKEVKKPSDIVLVVDVSSSMAVKRDIYPFYSQRLSYEQLDDGIYYVRHTDGKYYKISQYSGSGDYRGYRYTAGGKTYTVAKDGDSNTKYDGPFYKKDSKSRLSQTQTALNSLVTSIYDNSSASVDNRIAILTYASDTTTVLGLTDVRSSKSSITSKIKGLAASTGEHSYTDDAMEATRNILGTTPDQVRQKVVVLFTDGQPNSASSYPAADWNVADEAIAICKDMKDAGVRVFTIGMLDEETFSEDLGKMMSYMSSNYLAATDLSTAGTQNATSYYYNSPDATELGTASEAITDGLQSLTIDFNEDTEMKDSFLSSIKLNLPEGTSSVKAYTADCTTYTSYTNTFKFNQTLQELTDGSVEIEVVTDASGKQSVIVSGFDFTENWCGRKNTTGTTGRGKSLVLRIPFKYAPTAADLAGNNFTLDINGTDDMAGMYLSGHEISTYTAPAVRFTSLTIYKDGLKEGESTLFTIQRKLSGTSTYVTMNRIILIGTSDTGERVSHKQCFLAPNAEYLITEHTDWGWTYNPDTSSGRSTTQTKTLSTSSSNAVYFKGDKYNVNKFAPSAEAILILE